MGGADQWSISSEECPSNDRKCIYENRCEVDNDACHSLPIELEMAPSECITSWPKDIHLDSGRASNIKYEVKTYDPSSDVVRHGVISLTEGIENDTGSNGFNYRIEEAHPIVKLFKKNNGETLNLNGLIVDFIHYDGIYDEDPAFGKHTGVINDFTIDETNPTTFYTFKIKVTSRDGSFNLIPTGGLREDNKRSPEIHILEMYSEIQDGRGEPINTINNRLYLRKKANLNGRHGTGEDTFTISTGDQGTPRKAENWEECTKLNGIFSDYECLTDGYQISNIDICENTGYKWNKEDQTCTKTHEKDLVLDTGTGATYCKRKWDTRSDNNIGDDPPLDPCPTCNFINNGGGMRCEMKDKSDCNRLNRSTCELEKGCEYYQDKMDFPGSNLEPQISFGCKSKTDVPDSSSCITKLEKSTCEANACEWQCPFTPDSRNQSGYFVMESDGITSPNITLNDHTSYYYSPSDFSIRCKDGWENVDSTIEPIARCIENVDSDDRTYSHTYRMGFEGCIPKIKCGGNKIDGEPLNDESLQKMDLINVPSEFKKGSGSNVEVDRKKTPNLQGDFRCPAPKSLLLNAEEVPEWSEDKCCYSTGLCEGNTDPFEDIKCPDGQSIKKVYYGNSDVYTPAQGTTIETCCFTPVVPTITIPLDADYDELVGSDGSIRRDTFIQDFQSDIISILNSSEHIDTTVSSDMIEILDITEGSVVVTFRINKDRSGNVILEDQISKSIREGTTFSNVGAISNASPNYEPYDPKAKYFYWSDSLKKGITLEQIIFTVLMIVCIISSALISVGIVLK